MASSTTPSEVFRQRLREVRELRSLSQSELAERANLRPAAISHFETGARKPSFDNLKRLADALEVSTDYLLGRVQELEAVMPSDPIYRSFERLSAADRDFARKFMADLAKRGK